MFLLPLALTIFGFSISSVEGQRRSGGAASTFLSLGSLFAFVSSSADADSGTASAGTTVPASASGIAGAASFDALIGFFAFSAVGFVVFFDSAIGTVG